MTVKGGLMHPRENESVYEAYERIGELKERFIRAKALAAMQGEESRRRYRAMEGEFDRNAAAAHKRIGELRRDAAGTWDEVQRHFDDALAGLEETCDKVSDYIQVRLLT